MVVPGAIRSARPSVAYFSGVKGLWIRCSLSLMVKNARDIDHEVFSLRAIRRAATLPGSLFQRLSACARTLFKPVVLIRYGWPFTDLISFFGFELF